MSPKFTLSANLTFPIPDVSVAELERDVTAEPCCQFRGSETPMGFHPVVRPESSKFNYIHGE